MHCFSFPTEICFGPGVVSQLPRYLKKYNLLRPLLVTDNVVSELPFFKRIINDLEKSGSSPLIFNEVSKNPVKSDVLKGRDAYQDACDCIVGLGGGAALDVSRAVALSINNRRDLFDYDDLIGGSNLITEPIPHFITVPTTSGTGSEVGRSAIISEDKSKKKRILFHSTLIAKQVFADPELTYDLPPEITAATGMDALAHHLEAFLAKGFNPMCDGIALEGVRMTWDNLESAVIRPDNTSRSNMMLASLMGAVAFQKGLGIVHALSHPLSTLFDMHHGLANAINLPYGLEFNYSSAPDRFDRLAFVMGLKQGHGVPESIRDLNHKLGLPASLGQCGVKTEHIDRLAALALSDFCLPLNPRSTTLEDLKEIYQRAMG
ncbi:MAG: alcohol dehydrogenase [Cyclobacteriaceae bacterium]|nr:MAG: alcohol dehydrogenase [Cyclobacteriaceae bacterium]